MFSTLRLSQWTQDTANTEQQQAFSFPFPVYVQGQHVSVVTSPVAVG